MEAMEAIYDNIPTLDKKVVILEDDRHTVGFIKAALRKYKFSVYQAMDSAEAISFAEKKKVKNFLLDINMGKNREQEGLDALESIKEIDSNNFVSVYSAYPDRYKEMAQKLNVNYFCEKSANPTFDLSQIINEMMMYLMKLAENVIRNKDNSIDIKLKQSNKKNDVNEKKYMKLLKDKQWYKKNINKYVAIIDGCVASVRESELDLLSFIEKKYPNKNRFIKKVNKQDDVIDFPTRFEIE